MIGSLFTSSPLSALQQPVLARQTREKISLIPTRKFPGSQDDFVDIDPQKDLEGRLERVIAKMLCMQARVAFYNQRFQAQNPKSVKVWGYSYQKNFDKDEASFRKLIQSVQGLEEEGETRKKLIGQRLSDMQFLRVFTEQEWVGNSAVVGWVSTLPARQARYGVDYRMSQIEKSFFSLVEPSKTGGSPGSDVASSTSTEASSRLEGIKEKESDLASQVFAQLEDLIGRLAGLKEYALVYQHTVAQQPHPEVIRSAYLLMQDEQSSLQKKMETLGEKIKKVKDAFTNSLITERLLNTPDVPLLEEKLRRLHTLQGRLQKRLEELTGVLSSIKKEMKWTEEQLKTPVTIELSGLSESGTLGEVVALKEELEITGQDKFPPSKGQVEDWQDKNSALKKKISETREEYQKRVKVIGEQEKVLEGWLGSIEYLRKQMHQAMDKLSQSMKERQDWKPILASLKPISVKRDEVETPRAFSDIPVFFPLTETLVGVTSTPATDSSTSSAREQTKSTSYFTRTESSEREEEVGVRLENPEDRERISQDRSSDWKESKKKKQRKKETFLK